MILFVDKSYLDARSLISTNMDWAMLKPVVELVQFKYIKKLLGHDLYNALATKISAYEQSATPITPAYKTLLDDYIQPCMLWYIQAELAIPTKFRFEPKGLGERTGEGFQPISGDDLKMLIDEYRNNAEAYGDQLVKYLIEFNSTFPEYSTNSGLSENQPGTAYDSPFYFPEKAPVKPYPNWNE